MSVRVLLDGKKRRNRSDEIITEKLAANSINVLVLIYLLIYLTV